jgi:hypothetical protein
MPRPRNYPRSRKMHVNLPEDVIAEVDEKLYDPARGKTLYGGYSTLITNLLRKWLEDPSILPIQLVEERLD